MIMQSWCSFCTAPKIYSQSQKVNTVSMLPFVFMLLWRLAASKDPPFDFTIIARDVDIDKPTHRLLQQAQSEKYNNCKRLIFPLQHVAAGCFNQLLALHQVFGEQEEEQRFGFIAKKNLIFSRSKFERVIKDYGDLAISGSFQACEQEMKWLNKAAGSPDAKDSIYKVKRVSSGEFPALQLVVKVKGRYAVMEFPMHELDRYEHRTQCRRLSLAFDKTNVWRNPHVGWTRITQLSEMQNCCEFGDVECIHGRITRIRLSHRRLTGTIEWSQLPRSLIQFDLSDNQLSGAVQWNDLPLSLEVLYLAQNQFSGTLESKDLPRSLRQLALLDNRFSGAVQWKDLPQSLQWLGLSENQFSGAVQWQHFPQSLKWLHLHSNKFNIEDIEQAKKHLVGRVKISDTKLF